MNLRFEKAIVAMEVSFIDKKTLDESTLEFVVDMVWNSGKLPIRIRKNSTIGQTFANRKIAAACARVMGDPELNRAWRPGPIMEGHPSAFYSVNLSSVDKGWPFGETIVVDDVLALAIHNIRERMFLPAYDSSEMLRHLLLAISGDEFLKLETICEILSDGYFRKIFPALKLMDCMEVSRAILEKYAPPKLGPAPKRQEEPIEFQGSTFSEKLSEWGSKYEAAKIAEVEARKEFAIARDTLERIRIRLEECERESSRIQASMPKL